MFSYFLHCVFYLPIFCKMMAEKVICSQLDGLLWRDQCQVHSSTWEEKKHTVSTSVTILCFMKYGTCTEKTNFHFLSH